MAGLTTLQCGGGRSYLEVGATSRPNAENKEGFFGHQPGSLGSAVSSPSGVRGEASTANAFWVHREARKRGWWLQISLVSVEQHCY